MKHTAVRPWIGPAASILLLFSGSAASAQDVSTPASGSLTEADAFVRNVFSRLDTSRYNEAVAVYFEILHEEAKHLGREDRRIVDQHVDEALLVVPDEDLSPEGVSGPTIARWWRAQDPFPATPANERLEEHLERVAYAHATYMGEDPLGIDDRGKIFIRHGPPEVERTIKIPEIVEAFDFQYVVSIPDLPDNVIWTYPHVHDEAHYFFVRASRRGPYHLALPSEIVPQHLRGQLDQRSDRGRRTAAIFLHVLEEIYAQLALTHPFYGATYDRVAHYRGRPPSSQERPDIFIQETLAAASAQEIESAGRRAEVVPASSTNTRGMTEELDVAVRWARFLDEDNATRTEIYWALDPETLEPSKRLVRRLEDFGHNPSDEYLLSVAVARLSPDFVRRDVKEKHYRIRSTRPGALQAQSLTVVGDHEAFTLDIQWSQYWTRNANGNGLSIGPLLKIGTRRIADVQALRGSRGQFEMSDLKAISGGGASEQPYPYDALMASAVPDLYFELYNLSYGVDDLTRYTIEYDIVRAYGGDVRSTRVSSSYSGSERRTRERIELDLGELHDGEEIRIIVRATDEITGDQAERSILFHS